MDLPSRAAVLLGMELWAWGYVWGTGRWAIAAGAQHPPNKFPVLLMPPDVCDLALGIRREWKVPKSNESSPVTYQYHPKPRNYSIRSFRSEISSSATRIFEAIL